MGKISRLGNIGLAYKTKYFVYWASQEKLEEKLMAGEANVYPRLVEATLLNQ